MISPSLIAIARCPDCGGRLAEATSGSGGLQSDGSQRAIDCAGCGRTFDASRGYLDLRPAMAFAEQTKYLDEALHADARHVSVAPPLLGSRVRNHQLRAFLKLRPDDRVLDLGCGSGRTMLWNRDARAHVTGVDISPFFSREAMAEAELLLGDLRRLPIADGVFTKAWSLDVFEHLSPQALADVLREAHRVLAPGGALFVYTHVRKNGWAAGGVRLVNRLAHALERVGLIDLRQERLRKSDHLNPIADHDELQAVVARAGFRIERITYYTPIVGAFVENILARGAEKLLARRVVQRSKGPKVQGSEGPEENDAARIVRASAKAVVGRRGPIYLALRALSAVMMLDIWLWGRVRSGPFFALLRKDAARGPAPGSQHAEPRVPSP